MDRQPAEDVDWILDPNGGEAPLAPIAGDPYFPNEPAEEPEEEEPEEEEPEEDPEEDDYEPADVPDYLDGDSDDEEVPLDDAQPIECLSEEEVSLSPIPAATQREGKGLMMRRTPRMSVRAQPDMYAFVDRAIEEHGRMSGAKRKAPEGPAHYELGESSQTRPPPPPPAACACRAQLEIVVRRTDTLEDHVRSLHSASRTTRHQVEALEEEERQDTEALRTLCHRGHAARTDITNLQIRAGHHEDVENVTQTQLSAAERAITELRAENRRLREQMDEMMRYMRAHFGG